MSELPPGTPVLLPTLITIIKQILIKVNNFIIKTIPTEFRLTPAEGKLKIIGQM